MIKRLRIKYYLSAFLIFIDLIIDKIDTNNITPNIKNDVDTNIFASSLGLSDTEDINTFWSEITETKALVNVIFLKIYVLVS